MKGQAAQFIKPPLVDLTRYINSSIIRVRDFSTSPLSFYISTRENIYNGTRVVIRN